MDKKAEVEKYSENYIKGFVDALEYVVREFRKLEVLKPNRQRTMSQSKLRFKAS